MSATYDPTDVKSIDNFAQGLMGKTLRQVSDVTDADMNRGRGDLGTLIEKFYFKWTPPNNHLPDFAEAGLELKVTGVKRLRNGTLVPKERLVLSMIDYHAVVEETFQTSYVLNKVKLMLILFYLYIEQVPVIDLRFLTKKLWELSEEDIALILVDWQTIIKKIKDGKAHELSEGDTLYLGACTKGVDSSKRTTQPFSDELAKPRAFSFKPSYIKLLLEQKDTKKELYENFLKEVPTKPFEEIVLERLKPFRNKPVAELFEKYGKDISQSQKSKYAVLTNRLLGIKSKKVSEFEKAGIIIKTVRLQKNGVPKESISFPYFDYMKVIDQTWDESDFKDIVESKFFFVVLQETDSGLVFRGGKFWNMPYDDRLEAERVWDETVGRIKDYKSEHLPLTDFSSVAHVRPHGGTGQDKIPAPGGLSVVKKCFWLNASYIAKQLAQL